MQAHNFDVDIVIPSSKQAVKINNEFIQVDGNKINCADIVATKYGVSLVGPAKKPDFKRYIVDVKDAQGKTLSIKFSSTQVGDLLAEDHTYYYIMSGLWQHVKKHLVEGFIQKLNNKETITVGQVTFNSQGVEMSYKTWFFGKVKTEFVPWAQLEYQQEQGVLYIANTNKRKQKVSASFHDDWNAVVLNTFLHYLWQDHRKEKLQKGQTI